MLKLLKHELLSSYRPYLISLMVFIGVCLILPQFSSWIGIYEGLFSVVFIISTLVIFFTYLNIIYCFYKSMFTKAGYLTLTLPVNTREVIFVKLLSALIWLAIASLVVKIGTKFLSDAVIITYFENSVDKLVGLPQITYTNYYYVFNSLITLFFKTTSAILSCYFVISFAHTNRIRKNRIASAIGIYFIGLFVGAKFYDLLPQRMMSWLWFSAVFEICLSVLFYCDTVYLIDHKLEME